MHQVRIEDDMSNDLDLEMMALQASMEEQANPLVWWWLSFVDNSRPEGDKFIGACIVKAHGVITAAKEAHAQKCNPGGEVGAMPFPDFVDLTEWANRILTREQCKEFDQWMNETYS